MSNILVISPTPTHPQDAGNRARIFSLLSGIRSLGHSVCFVFVQAEAGDEMAMADAWDGFFPIPYQRPVPRWLKRTHDTWSKRLGWGGVLPYLIDDWYTHEISQHLDEIKAAVRPEVVLVEYAFLSKAFDCFGPKILKILDTHDVFGNRHRLCQQNGVAPLWFYTTVAQEKKALDRADTILAIQEEEATYYSRLTDRQVVIVGHMAQALQVLAEDESSVDRLLFVGSANAINIDAMSWFIAKIFPQLRMQIPGIEFEVVGKCAEKMTATDGLVLTGPVPDLTPYYRRARAVINPVRFGTGLKIKTIEALAMGRPLVTTQAGAAGLGGWKEKAFLVANSEVEFVEAIKRICSSPALRASLNRESHRFITGYNDTILQTIDSFIKTSKSES